MALLVMPMVVAVSTNIGTGVDIITEDFEPMVWMCDSRVVYDDFTEPGRWVKDPTCVQDCYNKFHEVNQAEERETCVQQDCREVLREREHNYAFEGEQISWRVLVMDKNGFEKITDVFATIGSSQGAGNDIEVNCDFDKVARNVEPSCNARILEEELIGEDLSQVAAYYTCTLTVETPDSMDDEYWVTVEAEDIDGLSGTMDENEYWYFNPEIALSIDGDLTFDKVRPGTSSYSDTLLVGNDAADGSGVMMDMFISGTDFYDSASSGAMCPTSNLLSLSSFRYYATHGAYSTNKDPRADVEGYVPILYGLGFNDPNPFYGNNEMIQQNGYNPTTGYTPGNVLSPGSEMALTFRLDLPEPCNGDFDSGQIYFYGEAI